MNDGSIIGKIEGNSLLENCPDIYVNFVHYSTIEEARDSWNSRKARINYSKIRVISTERMLTQEKLDLFNAIAYKK